MPNKKTNKKTTPKKKTAANDMGTAVKSFFKGYYGAVTGRTGTPKIK